MTRSNDAYAWTGHVATTRPYAVNRLNQYTSASGTTFSYDLNGNLTASGSDTYLYDVENRLVAASGSHNAALRYDPLGRLYEVTAGGTTTRFLYDGDALVAEYNSAGSLLRRHVHGSDAVADDPLVTYEGGTRRSLYADHQGSIVANATTGAVTLNAYDEYGIPHAGWTVGGNGRFGYTGQAWLAELGMWHYKARIYSPTLGRFLQTDPVGYDDQINLYAYVANDPVNHVDPSGQESGSISYHSSRSLSEGQPPSALALEVSRNLPVVGPAVRILETVASIVRGGPPPEQGSAVTSRASTLRPGPHARESIPAHPGRPTRAEQREINRIGDSDGCHTCGSLDSGRQSGNWTGDHQPPSALNPNGGPQRYYPQCARCSASQGAEVRNANRGNRPPPPTPNRPRGRNEDQR